jgi:hypothetical protein
MNSNSPQNRSSPSTIPTSDIRLPSSQNTPADSAKIKRQAQEQHVSLRDYCQDEIIGSMVLAEFE